MGCERACAAAACAWRALANLPTWRRSGLPEAHDGREAKHAVDGARQPPLGLGVAGVAAAGMGQGRTMRLPWPVAEQQQRWQRSIALPGAPPHLPNSVLRPRPSASTSMCSCSVRSRVTLATMDAAGGEGRADA